MDLNRKYQFLSCLICRCKRLRLQLKFVGSKFLIVLKTPSYKLNSPDHNYRATTPDDGSILNKVLE
jgi:hypothetical protein